MRIALGIEYDGSAFRGWQTQPGGGTVQDELEAALAQIAGEPVPVVCAGRTDAGVHATGQVVHFDAPANRPLMAWVRGVNSFLPPAVAVRWAQPVAEGFHARFSAFGRSYRYLLINRPQRTGVWHGRAGWYHHALDESVMQRGADFLLGEHDFSAFRVHGFRYRLPAFNLFLRVEPGHIGVALALLADGGGLSDEQACAGALRVVGGHQRCGHGARRAVARERRHDDAVGKGDGADSNGVKKGGHGAW